MSVAKKTPAGEVKPVKSVRYEEPFKRRVPLAFASAFLDPDLAALYLTRLFQRRQSR